MPVDYYHIFYIYAIPLRISILMDLFFFADTCRQEMTANLKSVNDFGAKLRALTSSALAWSECPSQVL